VGGSTRVSRPGAEVQVEDGESGRMSGGSWCCSCLCDVWGKTLESQLSPSVLEFLGANCWNRMFLHFLGRIYSSD